MSEALVAPCLRLMMGMRRGGWCSAVCMVRLLVKRNLLGRMMRSLWMESGSELRMVI